MPKSHPLVRSRGHVAGEFGSIIVKKGKEGQLEIGRSRQRSREIGRWKKMKKDAALG